MRSRLLSAVDPEVAAQVMRMARRRRFAKGEVIFHEGDPGDTIHLIEKGHVTVRVSTPLGESATLRILGAGDFVGELAVISPGPRNATVRAVDAVETMAVHRDSIDELRRSQPAVDSFLLEAAVAEIRRLSAQLSEALYVPVPKRVLRRVLEVSALFGSSTAEAAIPLSQDDVAGLAGTSRQTANRVLREAQERGLLRIARGRIVVTDREGLAKRAH